LHKGQRFVNLTILTHFSIVNYVEAFKSCASHSHGKYKKRVQKLSKKTWKGLRPRRRWVDNTEKELQEIECEVADWIHVDQNRIQQRTLLTTIINFRVP